MKYWGTQSMFCWIFGHNFEIYTGGKFCKRCGYTKPFEIKDNLTTPPTPKKRGRGNHQEGGVSDGKNNRI